MLTMPCISARSVEYSPSTGKFRDWLLFRVHSFGSPREDRTRKSNLSLNLRPTTQVHIPARIVLVDTSHPGNIGASARAMKTMGVSELVLVRPRQFPSDEATARAAGAHDNPANARAVDALGAAIADCGWVVGASARLRTVTVPVVDPRECAAAVLDRLAGHRVALLFGPEQSGLTNEDLARCRMLVNIPTAPGYGSLNLAMAVQVLCYELRMA